MAVATAVAVDGFLIKLARLQLLLFTKLIACNDCIELVAATVEEDGDCTSDEIGIVVLVLVELIDASKVELFSLAAAGDTVATTCGCGATVCAGCCCLLRKFRFKFKFILSSLLKDAFFLLQKR